MIISIKHKLMWSSLLRYMSQSYLHTAIICLTSLMSFETLSLKQKILSPLTLIYIVLLPLAFYSILSRQKDLNDKDTKLSVGTLYINQDTVKRSAVHFSSVYLIRRLVFAITIVLVPHILLQLYITIMCSLATLCYLVIWKPMENNVQNALAILNESVLLTCCYLLFLFTDYTPTPELKYYFGYYMLSVLYLDFGVNFILLVREIVLIIRLNCRRIMLHHRLRKQRKLRIQQQADLQELRLEQQNLKES